MCKNKSRFLKESIKSRSYQNLEKSTQSCNSKNTKIMKQKFVQKNWVVFVTFVLNKKFILSRFQHVVRGELLGEIQFS